MRSSITEMMQRSWQDQQRLAVRKLGDLYHYLDLSPDKELDRASFSGLNKSFPLVVTHSFLNRMEPGNPHDPLLLQVLPRPVESEADYFGSLDPVGESQSLRAAGLIQKYQHRVLMVTTSACAVHCRYCFRRNYPYENIPHNDQNWKETLNDIAQDPSIQEVILSGGDPLSLSDQRLFSLIEAIEGISHIRSIRLHTRLPTALPARISAEFCERLAAIKKVITVVVHINHPYEIQFDCVDALNQLRQLRSIHLLNQSVLLRGINDNSDTLAQLSWRLWEHGVAPYYLHQLDPVTGGMHFRVERQFALNLHNDLKAKLPGYLVPRLVQEEIRAPSKTWLS